MIKFKKTGMIFFTIAFVFMMFLTSVKADYKNTVTTNDFPSTLKVTLRGDGLVKSDGWQIYNKHTSSNYAICTAFNRENPNATYNCKSLDKWSDAVSAGVAAIIKQGAGSDGKMTPTEYARSEYAVNTYLISAAKGKYKKSAMKDFSKSVSAIKPLVKAAKAAEKNYNNFKKSNVSLKLKNLKCTGAAGSGTCTIQYKLSGSPVNDSDVQIAKPTVSGVTVISITPDSNKKSGEIKFNSPSTNSTLKASVTLTRTYYKAKDYDCGKNQSITPNIIKEKTATISLSAKREFKATDTSYTKLGYFDDRADCTIRFEKQSTNGTSLPGATIMYNNGTTETEFALEDSDEDEGIGYKKCFDVWSAGHEFTATYREASVPTGYVTTSSSSGSVTVSGASSVGDVEQQVVEIANAPNTKLTVKKIDGDTNQPLGGATLTLQKDGEVLTFDYTDENQTTARVNLNGTGSQSSWDSSKEITFVELFYDEQYDVVETKAPEGYIINNPSTAVVFENKDGSREQIVTLSNYKSSVKLSKQDITNGKEIPGATLKVIDGQGNVYDEWVSSTTPHEISKLEDGTYYLQETIAPKGYELNTTTVEFTVENGKSKSLVVMNDSPTKLTIANTLLGKSVISYVVGSMLIIIGAGVLGYEFKKKKASSKA